MEYHVKGVVRDSGEEVEFNVNARDEEHAARSAEAVGVTPTKIELIGPGRGTNGSAGPPSGNAPGASQD